MPARPCLPSRRTLCGDNFIKAQKALGVRHPSLYQAKHTYAYAVLSLLAIESPAVVVRNLCISLAILEKHYAAALQKGRTIVLENATRASETPRAFPRAQARLAPHGLELHRNQPSDVSAKLVND